MTDTSQLASTPIVVGGCLIFFIFWLLITFERLPIFPIGRVGGVLFTSCLMVAAQVLSETEALAAVDVYTLVVLFAGMLITAFILTKTHAIAYIRWVLLYRNTNSAKEMTARLALIAAVLSAFLSNDAVCVALTPVVVTLCSQFQVPFQPVLIALASAANIGSAVLPIGNPQNVIIAKESGISFLKFFAHLILPSLAAFVVNILWLLLLYSKRLVPMQKNSSDIEIDEDPTIFSEPPEDVPAAEEKRAVTDKKFLEIHSSTSSLEDIQELDIDIPKSGDNDIQEDPILEQRFLLCAPWVSLSWRVSLWRLIFAIILILGVVGLFFGLSQPFILLGVGVASLVLDWKDARPMLEKVDYFVLVFFFGMFLSTEGFVHTGVPDWLWSLLQPHCHVNSVAGITVLVLVILFLCVVVSNVPVVIMLGPQIAESARQSGGSPDFAWLLVAFVSTVAGNFIMSSSVANMIVSEKAKHAYKMSVWNHARFGVVSTLLSLAVGVPLLYVTFL